MYNLHMPLLSIDSSVVPLVSEMMSPMLSRPKTLNIIQHCKKEKCPSWFVHVLYLKASLPASDLICDFPSDEK